MSQAALDMFPDILEAQKQWQNVQRALVGKARDVCGKPDNDLRSDDW